MIPNDPIERQVVTFFEPPCQVVRLRDGMIYSSLTDLCDTVGLNRRAQLRRIRADRDVHDGVASFRVPTAGGMQEVPFLIKRNYEQLTGEPLVDPQAKGSYDRPA